MHRINICIQTTPPQKKIKSSHTSSGRSPLLQNLTVLAQPQVQSVPVAPDDLQSWQPPASFLSAKCPGVGGEDLIQHWDCCTHSLASTPPSISSKTAANVTAQDDCLLLGHQPLPWNRFALPLTPQPLPHCSWIPTPSISPVCSCFFSLDCQPSSLSLCLQPQFHLICPLCSPNCFLPSLLCHPLSPTFVLPLHLSPPISSYISLFSSLSIRLSHYFSHSPSVFSSLSFFLSGLGLGWHQ